MMRMVVVVVEFSSSRIRPDDNNNQQKHIWILVRHTHTHTTTLSNVKVTVKSVWPAKESKTKQASTRVSSSWRGGHFCPSAFTLIQTHTWRKVSLAGRAGEWGQAGSLAAVSQSGRRRHLKKAPSADQFPLITPCPKWSEECSDYYCPLHNCTQPSAEHYSFHSWQAQAQSVNHSILHSTRRKALTLSAPFGTSPVCQQMCSLTRSL